MILVFNLLDHYHWRVHITVALYNMLDNVYVIWALEERTAFRYLCQLKLQFDETNFHPLKYEKYHITIINFYD